MNKIVSIITIESIVKLKNSTYTVKDFFCWLMLLIWASLLLNNVCAWFSSLSCPKLVEIKLIDPAELIISNFISYFTSAFFSTSPK